MPVTDQDLYGGMESDDFTIANETEGIVVFHDPKTNQTVEWAGQGDIDGGDVREVASDLMKISEFRNTIHKGILSVVRAPAVAEAALAAQKAVWDRRQTERASANDVLINRRRTALGKTSTCIANKRGSDLCGNVALVTPDKPPLCSEHIHLTAEYAPYETGRFDPITQKPEMSWRRPSLQTARQSD